MHVTLGTLLAATLALGTTGCTSADDIDNTAERAAPTKTSSQLLDPVSGRPLADFKDSPTYPWRKHLIDTKDDYLEQLTRVDPDLGRDSDLRDALNTCLDAQQGKDQKTLARNAALRFGVPDVLGNDLLGITVFHVCP